MSEESDKLWGFAIDNPDYWKLLTSDDEPPEVVAMEKAKREAFQAARREVQRRYKDLLRAVWEELQTQTRGTAAEESFSRGKYDKSFKGGALSAGLQGRKGEVSISIEDTGLGKLGLYASFRAAKKRRSQQRASMPTAAEWDGWLCYEQPLRADAAAPDVAKALIDKAIGELSAYIGAPDKDA